MAGSVSALQRFTTLISYAGNILNALDQDTLDRSQQRTIAALKRLMADARLDIRDYEMADSREEMTRHSKAATRRLEQTREMILLASEGNIFGAVDVAQLTAELEQIAAEVRT